MQAEPITLDGTSRGSIQTFFYPVCYVQIFRPCSWTDLHAFMEEGDTFRQEMSKRAHWLDEQKIRHRMKYDRVIDDPDRPHYYRLFIEFSTMDGAEQYIERWTEWAAELSTKLLDMLGKLT